MRELSGGGMGAGIPGLIHGWRGNSAENNEYTLFTSITHRACSIGPFPRLQFHVSHINLSLALDGSPVLPVAMHLCKLIIMNVVHCTRLIYKAIRRYKLKQQIKYWIYLKKQQMNSSGGGDDGGGSTTPNLNKSVWKYRVCEHLVSCLVCCWLYVCLLAVFYFLMIFFQASTFSFCLAFRSNLTSCLWNPFKVFWNKMLICQGVCTGFNCGFYSRRPAANSFDCHNETRPKNFSFVDFVFSITYSQKQMEERILPDELMIMLYAILKCCDAI